MANIPELVKRIEEAKSFYYNGNPILSDAAYDALEDELRALDPKHPLLKKVGAAVPVGGAWPKVRHSIPMTSLNKAQEAAALADWHKSCGLDNTDIKFITEKMDGLSVELVYENRRLVQGSTRGDGEVGEDITRNVLLMKGAVKMLPPSTPAKVYVRGEIVCLKSDHKAHFPGESNPRNTANGAAKRQTGHEVCAHLTIVAYRYMPNGQSLSSSEAEYHALKDAGFNTPNHKVCLNLAGIETLYQQYVDKTRANLDYDIDGLVVEINDRAKREALGELSGNPKGAVAFKFPHPQEATTLRDIRWQVGNSGRITPVAEFDSVNLAGANVRQASLHNISNIADLVGNCRKGDSLLRKGDKIMVARRNDVIPYVEEVLTSGDKKDALPIPTECPSCKAALSRDGEYLVCRNEECEAQATGAIRRWVKKVGVLHVGDSLIEALVEAFPYVLPDSILDTMTDKEKAEARMNPADLYTLDAAKVSDLELSGRKVGSTADKAIKNLNDRKILPLHVLVGSLGIPLIGREMAKMVVDAGYDNLSKMLKAKIADIAAIPGVGPTKAEAFVTGFGAKVGLVSKLLENGIKVQEVSGPLKGQSFCCTGFRDGTLEDALVKAGGSIKSSVSRGLTYLIAVDKNSNSGKMQKARDNGVVVINPEEAWAMVGGKK